MSLRDHVKPALKQLHWLPVEQRITYKLCLFMHHIHSGQAPQYIPVRLCIRSFCTQWQILTEVDCVAQRITFCQEQELDLENEVTPTVAQPPGPLFLPTYTTLLTLVHSENDSRVYFLIVLTTDYCWRSWTCRIAAPYKFHIDD